MALHASDGSRVGTITNGSGTLVTRPTLVTGSIKQCKGLHAPDGSKYMCLVEEVVGEYVGPLDLVSGAVVAYGQRAMSSSGIGSSVYTLRRDSDDSTQDFVSASSGGVDADAILAWASGANVFADSWTDQSGNLRALTQSNKTKQPQWKAVLNSTKPSLLFDPSTSILFTESSVNFTNDSITVFLVILKTPGNNGSILGEGWATSNGGIIVRSIDSGGIYVIFSDDETGSGSYWESAAGVSVLNDGTTVCVVDFLVGGVTGTPPANTLVVNDSVVSTNADVAGPFTGLNWPMAFGNNDSTRNSGSYDGQVMEYILYPSILSDANRALIRQNIATYYGITL